MQIPDVKSIVEVFQKYPNATLVLVCMAQPLFDGMPPIRIYSMCTDNKFTADDVNARRCSMKNALQAERTTDQAWSGDGDSRNMKSMRVSVELGVPIPESKKKILYIFRLALNVALY